MLSLFLTTSYSAIIVSLLQTTSTAINSLKDLMNSPYTLSMTDVATNINYVNVSSATLFPHICLTNQPIYTVAQNVEHR
jgi:hypothetical protein